MRRERSATTGFGLTFRSSGHLMWFVLSVIGLAATSLIALALRFSRRDGLPHPSVVWQYPFGAHLGAAIVALVVTRAGRRQYRSFSGDCIWWNTLMAAVYGAILLAAWRVG